MFKGRSDHLVLSSNSISKTREFYEGILRIEPGTVQDHYITYDLNGFFLCFKQSSKNQNVGKAVTHLGLDFERQDEVKEWFEKLKTHNLDMSENLLGGPGKGPFRFYVKDPDGYTLEFETWEGSSD